MSEPRIISLAEHPSAATAIRRAKAYGGMAGYGLALLAGIMHGAALIPMLEHAVMAGIVAYLLTWAAAVAVWKRVLTGQATATVRRTLAKKAEESVE